jgi:regulator of protease activity HflC (stomatin/prohibitin superfamily)
MFLFIFFMVLAIVFVFASVKIVKQYQRGVILRLGKYSSLAGPGINFILPILDTIIFVDVRERVINVDPQKVITKDNVTVLVDAAIYYKIVDPVKAQFEVENFDMAVTTLAQTNLRNLIGDKSLDDSLTARDVINASLRDVLDDATDTWGVKVTRVEVQRIDPPPEITEAMSLQMKAEREKRAEVLRAQGVKQSDILEAEGQKGAEVLKAEGDAQAVRLRAAAEAEAIQKVADAAQKHFGERAEAWQRLEVSGKVFADNTKMVVPSNSDLINVLNFDGDKNIVPVGKKKGKKDYTAVK